MNFGRLSGMIVFFIAITFFTMSVVIFMRLLFPIMIMPVFFG
jgi:hypothetical protein